LKLIKLIKLNEIEIQTRVYWHSLVDNAYRHLLLSIMSIGVNSGLSTNHRLSRIAHNYE